MIINMESGSGNTMYKETINLGSESRIYEHLDRKKETKQIQIKDNMDDLACLPPRVAGWSFLDAQDCRVLFPPPPGP
jgi:hypothetical protein